LQRCSGQSQATHAVERCLPPLSAAAGWLARTV